LDRDLANMYSFGRKYTFNPFIGVFKHENLNKGTYKYCKVLPGAVIELEVTKQQYQGLKPCCNVLFPMPGDTNTIIWDLSTAC